MSVLAKYLFDNTLDELRHARGKQVSHGLREARTCGHCGKVEDDMTMVVDGVDDGPSICEHCVVTAQRTLDIN